MDSFEVLRPSGFEVMSIDDLYFPINFLLFKINNTNVTSLKQEQTKLSLSLEEEASNAPYSTTITLNGASYISAVVQRYKISEHPKIKDVAFLDGKNILGYQMPNENRIEGLIIPSRENLTALTGQLIGVYNKLKRNDIAAQRVIDSYNRIV